MRTIPNWISLSRVILSIVLIFIKPLSIAFYAIYIICGFSDIIDGFIARKTGSTSKLGAKLDSIADFIMVAVLLVVLYPIINLTNKMVIWVILIGIIRLASMFIALKKYKTFAFIHTYGNKFTGIALFIFPLFLPFIDTTVLIYIICVVASVSAIEEFIIQLTSNELHVNRHSIFSKYP